MFLQFVSSSTAACRPGFKYPPRGFFSAHAPRSAEGGRETEIEDVADLSVWEERGAEQSECVANMLGCDYRETRARLGSARPGQADAPCLLPRTWLAFANDASNL